MWNVGSIGKVSQAFCSGLSHLAKFLDLLCLRLTWQSFSSFLYKTHFANFSKLLFRSYLANFSNFCSGLVFAKFLKLFMFRTHLAKFLSSFCSGLILLSFFELLVQDSFGKVSQVFCVQNSFGKVSQAFRSGLIWQSSSSFMFTTDLANGSIVPTAWEKKFKHHHPLLQKTPQLVPPFEIIFKTFKSWRKFSLCDFFFFVQHPFPINVHFDWMGFIVVLGTILL